MRREAFREVIDCLADVDLHPLLISSHPFPVIPLSAFARSSLKSHQTRVLTGRWGLAGLNIPLWLSLW